MYPKETTIEHSVETISISTSETRLGSSEEEARPKHEETHTVTVH